MLVLSRKLGEQIVVPHCKLTLTVVAIEGNTVRLGISAPEDISVYREELDSRSPKKRTASVREGQGETREEAIQKWRNLFPSGKR